MSTTPNDRDEEADAPSTSSDSVSSRHALRAEESLPSVAQNLARLRECEDYEMALALQEQEFSEHYRLNRTERQTMGVDIQTTIEEQRLALEAYMRDAAEIARRDEELARSLQHEIEEEERRLLGNQARLDEEYARRLQMEEERISALLRAAAAASETAGTSAEEVTPQNSILTSDNLNLETQQASSIKPLANQSLNEHMQNELTAYLASGRAPLTIRAQPPSYAECITSSETSPPPPPFSSAAPPPTSTATNTSQNAEPQSQERLSKDQS